MSGSRTLLRKLDLDLIARLANGVKHAPKPVRKVKPARAAETYRGARRNAVRIRRAAYLAAKRSGALA